MNSAYFQVLAVSMAIELPLVAVLLLSIRHPRVPWILAVAFAVNLFTHGLMHTLLPLLPLNYWYKVPPCEAVVALVEGCAYAWLGRVRPVWLAFAVAAGANLASWMLGEPLWAVVF